MLTKESDWPHPAHIIVIATTISARCHDGRLIGDPPEQRPKWGSKRSGAHLACLSPMGLGPVYSWG